MPPNLSMGSLSPAMAGASRDRNRNGGGGTQASVMIKSLNAVESESTFALRALR